MFRAGLVTLPRWRQKVFCSPGRHAVEYMWLGQETGYNEAVEYVCLGPLLFAAVPETCHNGAQFQIRNPRSEIRTPCMLDLQFICDQLDQVAENCRNRGVTVDLEAFVKLRQRRGELIAQVDQLRREQNELSQQIPKEKDSREKQALIARGKELRQQVAQREGELKEAEGVLRAEQVRIPNMTHPAAPVGRLADDNKVVRTWGTKPRFDFQPLDHVALAEKH